MAVADPGARTIRARARSRRIVHGTRALRVTRHHLRQLAPRGAPQRHALRSTERVLELAKWDGTPRGVLEGVGGTLAAGKVEHGGVITRLVEAAGAAGGIRPRGARAVFGPLVPAETVRVPRGGEDAKLVAGGKQLGIVRPG